jgi:hypothetical protein
VIVGGVSSASKLLVSSKEWQRGACSRFKEALGEAPLQSFAMEGGAMSFNTTRTDQNLSRTISSHAFCTGTGSGLPRYDMLQCDTVPDRKSVV